MTFASRALAALLGWWALLPERRLTRRGLMELEDDQLAELGFSRDSPTARRAASRRRHFRA